MFFYFDMGNVLLHFDHARACHNLAALASCNGGTVTPLKVKEVLFDTGVHLDYERGALTTAEFCDYFCGKLGLTGGERPDNAALAHAASDIFWPNVAIKPLVAALAAARLPLGILSNTNPAHFDFVRAAGFPLVPEAFSVLALSYELKALKPEAEIYDRAAALAGVPPHEIFFVDDNSANVQAARRAGFDAVQYHDARRLAVELHARGVSWNF